MNFLSNICKFMIRLLTFRFVLHQKLSSLSPLHDLVAFKCGNTIDVVTSVLPFFGKKISISYMILINFFEPVNPIISQWKLLMICDRWPYNFFKKFFVNHVWWGFALSVVIKCHGKSYCASMLVVQKTGKKFQYK